MSIQQLFFIDAQVADIERLVSGLPEGSQWYVLNPEQDGVLQMQEIAAGYSNLNSIQIISHGSAGALSLGASTLTNQNISSYRAELGTLGASLNNTGDILLYGCDVASGAAGQQFINQLAQFTGADVAASDDLTGASSLAGDWDLEYSVGTVTAPSLLHLDSYQDTLHAAFRTDPFIDQVVTLQAGGALIPLPNVGPGGATLYATEFVIDNFRVDPTNDFSGSTNLTGTYDADFHVRFRNSNGDLITGAYADLAGGVANFQVEFVGRISPYQTGTFDVVLTQANFSGNTSAGDPLAISLANAVTGRVTIGPGPCNAITWVTPFTINAQYFANGQNNTTPPLDPSYERLDTTPPQFLASSPADNAAGVRAGANLILVFDEAVKAGTGNITITDGGSDTRIISVTDTSQVSFAANVVSINPNVDLRSNGTYEVIFGNGVILDSADNPFAGITSGAFNFTVNATPTGSVTVTGTKTQGQILTAGNNLTDADGLGSIRYQWQVSNNGSTSWTNISGATAGSYTITEAQVNKYIRVVTSYTDGHGTAESVSSSASAQIANLNDIPTGIVTITGTMAQGQVLVASNTLADIDGLGSISYRWQVSSNGSTNWTNISGATANAYTLAEAEVNKYVRVVASYTDGHGTVESVPSSTSTQIANINDAPTGTVTFSGEVTQNQNLVAANNLADADGLGAIAYRWQISSDGSSGWADINGAITNRYILTKDDANQYIRVVASYTDGHGTAESVSSRASTRITNINNTPTGTVTINGSVTQNRLLTANNTLADIDGLGTISSQWQVSSDGYSNWTNINGATASSYTLTEAQAGQYVRVVASYIDGYGTPEIIPSMTTALYWGDNSNTFLRTGLSNDNVLIGGTGNDTLIGGAGNDEMHGGAGNDIIFFGVDDTLLYANGATRSDGGTGYDTAILEEGFSLNPANWSLYSIEAVVGNSSANIINGLDNSVNYQFEGGGDNDTLRSAGGNDLLIGGAGNDTLIGGAGNDRMDGGIGTDQINYIAASAAVNVNLAVGTATGGDGTDTLVNIENIDGSTYNDTLTGDSSDNVIWGGAGNDTLNGGAGNDTLHGGAGNDEMHGGAGNDIIHFGSGDVVYANSAPRSDGGTGYDTAVLEEGFVFNTNNWSFHGFEAVVGNSSANLINGLENNVYYNFEGGAGNDTLHSAGGNDLLNGGDGDDTLIGGAGADQMIGGTGNDTYDVDNTGDLITEAAGAGTDGVNSSISYTLGTNLENLTLTGISAINGTGNDLANVIIGNTGNNTITGGAGNDILIGDSGADQMLGGTGDDIYYVDNTGDSITEVASAGTDRVNSSISYTLGANLENLTLTGTGNINGTGNDLANVIVGNTGINILTGGAGNDTLNGSSGADQMLGGIGDDIYYVDNTGDSITEVASAGTDIIYSSISYTIGANLENLALTGTVNINGTGNDLANRIIGNTGNNILTGGAGNDLLSGGTGADQMLGGTGNDIYYVDNTGDSITEAASAGTDRVNSSISYTLGANLENLTLSGTVNINGTGNDLANLVIGNTGNNILNGGTGNDTLTGGSGVDVFRFVLTTEGIDSITDFQSGTDRIQVVSPNFANIPVGTLAADRLVAAGTTLTTGNAVFLYNGTTGGLSFDRDGNGSVAAVQIATLTGHPTLQATDFQVVAA